MGQKLTSLALAASLTVTLAQCDPEAFGDNAELEGQLDECHNALDIMDEYMTLNADAWGSIGDWVAGGASPIEADATAIPVERAGAYLNENTDEFIASREACLGL